MKQFDLSFRFKGGRDYVHGTDIFNEMMGLADRLGVSNTGQVQMAIHRMMREQLTAYWVEDEMIQEPAVVFTFGVGEDRQVFALKENGKPVSERYPYDEDSIVTDATISDEEILHSGISSIDFSNIEKVVALNKGHLQALFNENSGKWIFSKISVNGELMGKDPERIKLVLKKRIGLRLTKTNILFDDQPIGDIFFSVI